MAKSDLFNRSFESGHRAKEQKNCKGRKKNFQRLAYRADKGVK